MKRVNRITGRMVLILGVLVSALVGCMTVGPDYQPPTPSLLAAWSRDSGAGVTPATTNDSVQLSRWWSVFKDPILTELMERARTGNQDVRQAEARLRQARAQRNQAQAARMPTVAANASARRSRGSEETGSGQTASMFANRFDASWEMDLFGAQRRQIESAQATLEASQEEVRDAQVSLFAEVALNYVEVRLYQARLAITATNLAAQSETYAMARWRQQASLVTQLDVDQARLSLEQTRSEIPSLQTGLEQAENQLATLLGQAPGSLKAVLDGPSVLPTPAGEIAVGVPADVLRRRPDVRRAERRLAAQTAQIGVAQAARYPDFTLSGSIGLEALTVGNLYTVGARTAQAAVQAGWTLFDGGRIRQTVEIQTALQEEALGVYEAAVLTAMQEVEDALVAYANEQDRRRALREAVVAGQSAFELARNKYASGLVDFQAVLNTQQALLTVQDKLASSDAEVVSHLIRLYKALGGGWNPLTPEIGPIAEQP